MSNFSHKIPIKCPADNPSNLNYSWHKCSRRKHNPRIYLCTEITNNNSLSSVTNTHNAGSNIIYLGDFLG